MSPRPGVSGLLHLLGASLLLTLGVWVSSGTLAPYAATLAEPFVWEPCKYLLNIDHYHFKAVFLMLDGAPREQWEFSVVLRRLLQPLLGYPLMKALGYGAGGVVVNVLLAVGSLAAFWRSLQRRLGGEAPPAVLWLLATYPGFFYWAGLPYSYGAIVPLSLLSMVLLWRVEALSTVREAALSGLLLGVLFTGYDLLPFFGAAAVLLLLYRRLWGACAAFTVAQLVPTVAVSWFLSVRYAVPFRNSNTEAYFNVLKSYFQPDFTAWGPLLAGLPRVFLDNYLYSNFLFLPLLFLVVLLAARWLPRGERPLGRAEIAVLAAALLLFLFNNAAPPYPGWQLRGSWIPRLYQPVVVAMVAAAAGLFARAHLLPPGIRRAAWAVLGLTLAVNAWVVFAPVLGSAGLSGELYFRFYRHAPGPVYAGNLERFGARPLGFCGMSAASPANVTH